MNFRSIEYQCMAEKDCRIEANFKTFSFSLMILWKSMKSISHGETTKTLNNGPNVQASCMLGWQI